MPVFKNSWREFLQQRVASGVISKHQVRCLRWTPHPVIVIIRDNRDYIRVLLYPTIPLLQGGGVLLTHVPQLCLVLDAQLKGS